MFSQSVPYYDLLYASKDYAGEAAALTALIQKRFPDAKSILDVACGTHAHAPFLTGRFEVDGLDYEERFLNEARKRNPKGQYVQGDMRDFDMGRTYDVVVCLFSSIGYVESRAELDEATACFARHLNPGGLVIVEPWFTPQRWTAGHTAMRTFEDEHTKIARMNLTGTDGNHSVFTFHYLVGTPEGVETFSEDHRMSLFTPQEMRESLEKAGLSVSDIGDEWPCDRGLWLGQSASG